MGTMRMISGEIETSNGAAAPTRGNGSAMQARRKGRTHRWRTGAPPPALMAPPDRPDGPFDFDGFHARLRWACQGRRYAEVGRLTRTNRETVRRYLRRDGPSGPSIAFIARLCRVSGLSADWLLVGRLPVWADALPRAHARGAEPGPGALLTELNRRIEDLSGVVERMEDTSPPVSRSARRA